MMLAFEQSSEREELVNQDLSELLKQGKKG